MNPTSRADEVSLQAEDCGHREARVERRCAWVWEERMALVRRAWLVSEL